MPASMERVAAKDSGGGHDRAARRPVNGDAVAGVLGARRMEATVAAEPGRKCELVAADQGVESPGDHAAAPADWPQSSINSGTSSRLPVSRTVRRATIT